jgi:hypothetical protein
MLFIAGCKKNNASETLVFVSTSDMSNFRSGSSIGQDTILATGAGDVDVAGVVALTERGVCWSTVSNPTTNDNKIKAGSGTGHFSGDLTGLIYGNVYHARAYAINNGKTYYGNDVKFIASVPKQLILNGDFSMPQNASVVLVDSIQYWRTDETNAGLIGRGTNYWNYPYYIWTNDWAKSFYQVVGKVPSAAADYAISFNGNYDWTDWSGYSTKICVIFSSFTGNDPTTRVTIDTVKLDTGPFPGYGNNWGTKSASYSLSAGSAHAGENFVIEFKVLPYPDPSLNANLWYDFDNMSVIQTLK